MDIGKQYSFAGILLNCCPKSDNVALLKIWHDTFLSQKTGDNLSKIINKKVIALEMSLNFLFFFEKTSEDKKQALSVA